MTAFLKKYSFWFIGIGILLLYFFTRFYNILSLPIFTDEAIYVRWSQIASNDAAWRFISLTDGKQPMYVWIAMILMKLIHDPLLAGRTVSVIAGFFSMLGLFFLTNEVFKNPSTGSGPARKIALLACFLYVLYPFSLVYDRMALYDSLVSMFIIWSLYFEILLVRHIRLDLALILGMIVGGGMLTKTNANAAFLLLPFLLLLFNFKDKQWKQQLGRLVLFSFVSVIIANVMYLILRLSPFFHIITDKNYVFAYRPEELLAAPFSHFFANLHPLSNWLIIYMTAPFLILVVSSFLIGKKYFRERLLLLAWFIIPFIIIAFIGRLLYPRHILFITMPLLVLGSYAFYYMIVWAKRLWLQAVICLVFLSMFAINDYFIITNFAKASVPQSDLGQFVNGWPSGGGVKETVSFIQEKAKSGKVYVGTGGTFGLMPYALEMYFFDNPNVTIKGFWPVSEKPPREVVEASKKMPTYFVFYQECPSCPEKGLVPHAWNGIPVIQIQKKEKETYYTLYEIK